MMKENNQLDELFRSKLEGFEQDPPSYVWDRIQESQKGKKRRKVILFWKAAGIAAAVLLAFGLGWQLQQPRHAVKPLLSNQQEQTNSSSQQQAVASQNQVNEGANIENKNTSPVQQATSNSLAVSAPETKAPKENLAVNSRTKVQGDASNSHENSEAIIAENRPQNKEQFQLLRLLEANLNGNSGNGQLVDVRKKAAGKTGGLSKMDQAIVNENARLLAENKSIQKSHQWQVGAMLTPGYNVNQSSQDKVYASNMSFANSNENLQLGGGISVEYKTGKRWSIQSGVYYSKLDQSSSNQPYSASEGLYADASGGDYATGAAADEASYFNTSIMVKSGEIQLNTPVGVVAMDNLPSNAKLSNSFETLSSNNGILLTQTEFKQNFEYIEIPLILRYQLIDATFNLELLGGLNTSVLIGNNAYAIAQSSSERIGATRDMNTLNYSTTFGFGVGYGLTDHLRFQVEPQLKYFLGSLSNNSNINFKPYTIGVSTGFSYRF